MIKYYIIVAQILLFLFWGCGGGTSTSTQNTETNTNQKPHITLHGDKTIILHKGDTFSDPGATALDPEDGDLTSSIITTITPTPIDTSKPGTYTITYSVTDKNGNKTNVQRIVTIYDTILHPESRKQHTLVINEVLAVNSHSGLDPDFKAFSDWIEIYNNGNKTEHLENYYLSDDLNNTQKWQLPVMTLAPKSRVVFWADKHNQGKHTNFSLNSNGENLLLSDSSGNTLDSITFKKQKRDISVTKIDGKNYFMVPTPGKTNTTASNALVKSKKPQVDHESGFYSGSITINLSQDNNASIYYTLDGSIPFPGKTGTHRYTTPVTISKTTVLRAAALEKEKFLSSPVTHTYLIDEQITLPVMSVTIDEAYLYNSEYGIYTAGNHTNYNQDWIRPGSVEFIKDGKTVFSKNIGIKIHGNNTRAYPQKSLAFYTKSQFGTKSIDYPLFAQKPFIKKVKSFVLRSGGTEWGRTLIGDGIQHTIVRNMMDIDYQSFGSSVVMFLNGKYWGLHHIREKMNADYLAANHGVDPKNVDLLANDAEVSKGSNQDYLALKSYIRSHDLSQSAPYHYVVSKIDLKEYMNYIITESFTGNGSIHHNIKYWKEHNATAKWRWLLFDLDRGFRYLPDDALKYVADNDETSIVIRNLLHNREFVHDFASRYFTHLNTTFRTDRMTKIIQEKQATIAQEVQRHFQRWPKDHAGNAVSVSTWQGFMDDYYTFAQQRGALVREDLRNDLNLTGNATLEIPKSTNGIVTIDDVPLNEDFRGDYFNGATVTLKAVPDTHSKFIQWSDGMRTQTRRITLTGNMTLTAQFQLIP